MLSIKEQHQKSIQEEAKNYKDSDDYSLEQKRTNLKIKLVRNGSEIKIIKQIILDLKELLKESQKANYIFVVYCGEYSDRTLDLTTNIDDAINILIDKGTPYSDIFACKDNEYYLLYGFDECPKSDKEKIKEEIIIKLKEFMEEK